MTQGDPSARTAADSDIHSEYRAPRVVRTVGICCLVRVTRCGRAIFGSL